MYNTVLAIYRETMVSPLVRLAMAASNSSKNLVFTLSTLKNQITIS
jgi:hypothetical protein